MLLLLRRAALRETSVRIHCMCQVLSVCAPVCAKCCQCVPLYVPSSVSACNCMSQVLSVCATVCANFCPWLQLYVPSFVNVCHRVCQVLSLCATPCAKCCQFVHLYVPSDVSACYCMCQVLSVGVQVHVESVPILRKLCSKLSSLFLFFLFHSLIFSRLLKFL